MSLQSELKKYAKPEPNKEFLGFMPLGLWFYNMISDSVPDKGFRHWVKYGLGNPPVIFEYYYADRSKEDMQNDLFSKGYFDSRISTEREIKGKKIRIGYKIEAKEQYMITSVNFPELTGVPVRDSLIFMIDSLKDESLVRVGVPYDFATLKDERDRINDVLRDKGYFNFAADYLIFKLDSSYSEKTIDVYLDLKEDIPKEALRKYYLNKITVYADYSLEGDSLGTDTLSSGDYRFIYHDHFIKPGALSKAILLKKGELYSFDKYSSTLNKVMGLGVYKYANISFDHGSGSVTAMLNADLFLTRSIPKSVRLEIQAITKSNDFAGPGINISYQDRNLFHGAELFHLDLNGSYETQIAGSQKGLNTWQFGVKTGLEIPRFIVPFFDANRVLSPNYTPHTTIDASYNLYNRAIYFTMNSAQLSYGYDWRETISKRHEFKIFNLNYSNLSNTSASFDDLLNNNPLIRESFEQQFLLSLDYRYTFNDQLYMRLPVNTFFQAEGELAGNTLNLAERLSGAKKADEKNSTLLGIPYSQFVRTTADLRFYINSKKYNALVNRFLIGLGLPYGNSNALPYRKQFYIGGPNSIRSFQFRSVGPGIYYPESVQYASFIDQTGEIKLEGNLEYRFTIYKLVKGALFLDAGNIWLIKIDELKPGGRFEWKRFLDDLAMGTGFGIRFDASFFVLRFDLGVPVRKPWLPDGQQWTLRNIDLSSPTWRRDNLVLNIAIGYPF